MPDADELNEEGEFFTESEIQEMITWIESLTIAELAEIKRDWEDSVKIQRQIQ